LCLVSLGLRTVLRVERECVAASSCGAVERYQGDVIARLGGVLMQMQSWWQSMPFEWMVLNYSLDCVLLCVLATSLFY
jgi:hypothetical protein